MKKIIHIVLGFLFISISSYLFSLKYSYLPANCDRIYNFIKQVLLSSQRTGTPHEKIMPPHMIIKPFLYLLYNIGFFDGIFMTIFLFIGSIEILKGIRGFKEARAQKIDSEKNL